MSRQIKSAAEIQAIVSERLRQIQMLREPGAAIVVPKPTWREPDESGCNWEMTFFRNAYGYLQDIAYVLGDAYAEFNLEEPGETDPRA